MAVAGNNEEVKTVLEISTSKSQKSMKDLRNEIKELRDELVNLDRGSQEYADTISVLGNKTNQLKELMGDIARTNTDFGTTVANVANVMSGGVAAVQGLTAGLSLLGVKMGDDDKLTQTLVKSMALLQSLSTMDKAIKSFKALSLVIKSNIAAAGGLGKALKALAVSNPFTAILAAATAVVAVMATIIGKQKEMKSETEIHDDAVKALTMSYYSLADAMNGLDSQRLFDADDKMQKKIEEVMNLYNRFANETTNRGRTVEAVWNDFYNTMVSGAAKSTDAFKGMSDEQIKSLIAMTNAQYNYNESLYERNRIYNYTPAEGSWIESEAQRQEMLKLQQEKINELQTKRNGLYKTYLDNQKKSAKTSKTETDLEKQKYDLAKKRLDLQKTLDETELNARYEEEKRAAKDNAEQLLAIEEKYQSDRKKLNEQYYNDAIRLAEDFKKTRKKETDVVDVDQTIANLKRQLQEGADGWETFRAETEKSRKELELSKQTLQAEIAELDRMTERIQRNSAMQTSFDRETVEYLKQKQEQYGILSQTSTAYYEAERAYQRQILDLELQHADLIEDQTALDGQLATLQSQYEQGLVLYDEYERQKAEIRQQYAENQAAIDENEVEQERTKLERKKELNEAYRQAISGITGQLVGLLNSMADAEGVSFEDSKKMRIAAATISTIQGGIDAFMGYLNSGIPQPYASILGAAASAATVAMGMMEIQKIRNTKPGSATAATSSAATQVVQSPPQIVNLNQVSDQVELPDQRVYVVESDITSAQRRVQVIENNSQI